MPAVVNGQTVNVLAITILGNPRLRPERSLEYEYGADAYFWDQRVDLQVTVANKMSRNVLVSQLVGRSILSSVGDVVRRWDNVARVMNRSIEGSVNVNVIDRDDLRWSVSTSGSTIMNKVTDVGWFLSSNAAGKAGRIVSGYPIDGIWARPVVGYRDINGDGLLGSHEYVLTDSSVYVGWGQPRYRMTYTTSLNLFQRRLTLSANVAQDVGVTQFQGNSYRSSTFIGKVRGREDVTASLAEQVYASQVQQGIMLNTARPQTFSVLRLQSMSGDLELPEIARRMHARTFSLQVSGSNLGLWTQYAGRDPGVNGSQDESRVDTGRAIGQPRNFSITFRFGL